MNWRVAPVVLQAFLSFTPSVAGLPSQVNLAGPVVFPDTATLTIELGGSNAPACAGVTYDQHAFTGVSAVCPIDGPILNVVLLPTPTVGSPPRVIDTQSGGSVNVASFLAGLMNHVEHTRPDGVKYVADQAFRITNR